MLVIVILGVSPVKTNLIYDTLQECLNADDEIRGEIADAVNRWQKWAPTNPEQSGYPDSEPFMTRKIGMQNLPTCIPHAPIQ